MSYTLALTVNFSTPSQSFTVPVESFSFGVDVPVTISGSGTGAGKPVFSALTINKMLDVNTVALFSAAATGRAIPTVTLALTRAGNTTPDTTYTLTTAFVTEVSDGGNSHGGPFATEQVMFAFQAVKITSGGSSFSFDVTTNKGG